MLKLSKSIMLLDQLMTMKKFMEIPFIPSLMQRCRVAALFCSPTDKLEPVRHTRLTVFLIEHSMTSLNVKKAKC